MSESEAAVTRVIYGYTEIRSVTSSVLSYTADQPEIGRSIMRQRSINLLSAINRLNKRSRHFCMESDVGHNSIVDQSFRFFIPTLQCVASFWQSITSFWQSITSFRQSVSSFRQSVTSFRQSVTSYRQSVTSYRQSVTSYRFDNLSLRIDNLSLRIVSTICHFVSTICHFVSIRQSVTSFRQCVTSFISLTCWVSTSIIMSHQQVLRSDAEFHPNKIILYKATNQMRLDEVVIDICQSNAMVSTHLSPRSFLKVSKLFFLLENCKNAAKYYKIILYLKHFFVFGSS
jgi:hypothetical protein